MEGESVQKRSVGGKGRGAAVAFQSLAVSTDSNNIYTLCSHGNFYYLYLFICYKVDKNVGYLNFRADNTNT